MTSLDNTGHAAVSLTRTAIQLQVHFIIVQFWAELNTQIGLTTTTPPHTRLLTSSRHSRRLNLGIQHIQLNTIVYRLVFWSLQFVQPYLSDGEPDTDNGVRSQYRDLPYPPYTKRNEIQERGYYLEHTTCTAGNCSLVSKNSSSDHSIVVSLELDLLNALLYEVGSDNNVQLLNDGFLGEAKVR